MIRHDARGIQLVFGAGIVQNSFERDVPLGVRKLPMPERGKRDHVFGPGAFKMWKTTLL